jgi:anthranilate 1,2-dioxygenase small subunit
VGVVSKRFNMNSTVVPLPKQTPIPSMVRDAIATLQMQYVHAIDDDEIERWPQFFTEKCVYQIIPRIEYDQGRLIGVWFCDNRAMLEDRVSALREVNVYEPHVYRHVIGPTEIVDYADGAYRARTSFIVVRTMSDGSMSVFSAGRYVDEIVVEGEAALLRKRSVVTDSYRYDTLVVIPL